jgi:predicted dehydrogenase
MVEAIRASEGSEAHSVVGRDPGRLATFADDFAIPNTTTDLDVVLSDPDIDVVYIGLPNHKHHEATIAASNAGKAVLSEKSLTTTVADAEALTSAVADNATFFVEGLMYLAHPLYRTVVEVLSDGRLGTLHSVSGRYAASIADVVNTEGRGTIYNLGCYPVSLLHLVMETMCGPEAFADHELAGFGNPTGGDGTIADAVLSMRFANGVLATIHSADTVGMAHDFTITGHNGVLRFETNPWLPLAGTNELTWLPFNGEPASIEVNDDHDSFFHQVKLVERCVAEGRTEAPRPSPRLGDSLEIMKLLTAWEAACLGAST